MEKLQKSTTISTKVKKILLLTTSQPSLNPRLVKEADALTEAGYQVKVLYCYRTDWALEHDRRLLAEKKWEAQLVGGTPNSQRLRYHWTRLRRKINEYRPLLLSFAWERTFAQAYDELYRKSLKEKADLYIGHNPGALAIVARVADKLGVPYAFDAEDFHSGELPEGHFRNQIVKELESRYLKGTQFLTAASPLIAEAYKKQYPELRKVVVVNNVFPLSLQPKFVSRKNRKKIRLIWFSQTLGKNRGIQDVLKGMGKIPYIPAEIILIGRSTPERFDFFNSFQLPNCQLLKVSPPMNEKKLIELCSFQDIGLALEPGFSLNNDIALSNKLFTYLLSGNAVITSNTLAQSDFMSRYSGIGKVYPVGDSDSIAKIIEDYWLNQTELEEHRVNAWQLANKKLNWDNEQRKILPLVKSVF